MRSRVRAAAVAALAAVLIAVAVLPVAGERYDFRPGGPVVPRGGAPITIRTLPKLPSLDISPRVPDVGYTDEYQGVDVVMEAPWRVQVRDGRPSYVPVLFFVPDVRYPDLLDFQDPLLGGRAAGVTVPGPLKRAGLHLREATLHVVEDGRLREVYRDRDPGGPTPPVEVVDELGGRRSRLLDPPAVDATVNEGWHRIVRVPTTSLVPNLGPRPVLVELHAQLVYDRHYDRDHVPRVTHRKRLRVVLSRTALPSPGPRWLALDVHHHTVAEYTRKTYPTAPRKAFGSPLQMVKEALYALGMVDVVPEHQRLDRDHPVIATDHNTFFSDDDTIMVGPTSPEGVVRLAYLPGDHFAALPPEGRAEFERMRAALGEAAGQEVTLQGPRLGHHLLAYRTRHFAGGWHGGCLDAETFIAVLKTLFHFFKNSPDCAKPRRAEDRNDNGLAPVLEAIARSPGFPRGFAYASHPLNCDIPWTPDMLTTSVFDVQPGTGLGRYRFVRDPRRWKAPGPREFVFKGLQVWNSRTTFLIEGKLNFQQDIDFYNLDPFAKNGWKPVRSDPARPDADESLPCTARPGGDPWWEVHRGLLAWQRLVRDGLRFRLETEPDVVFIRKVYAAAGTDAHGDFNYETAIPGTFFHDEFQTDWGWTVGNNGFGLVRTHVELADERSDGRSVVARALDALGQGRAVLTDGPVVSFALDAEPRFHSATHTWRDGAAPFDADGEIGGGPASTKRAVGAFDGGRTMLVRRGAKAQIRYRWANTPEFGGSPLEISLYWNALGDRAPERLAELTRSLAEVREAEGERIEPLPHAFTDVTAVSLAARTKRVNDPRLGDDEPHRAYTNPVWVVPVDVGCTSGPARPDGRISAGGLVVTFTFPVSMSGRPQTVRLHPVGADGASRPREGVSLVADPAGSSGWSTAPPGTARHTRYRAANDQPVVPGRFVAYLEAPEDHHGNGLNPLALALEVSSGTCTTP